MMELERLKVKENKLGLEETLNRASTLIIFLTLRSGSNLTDRFYRSQCFLRFRQDSQRPSTKPEDAALSALLICLVFSFLPFISPLPFQSRLTSKTVLLPCKLHCWAAGIQSECREKLHCVFTCVWRCGCHNLCLAVSYVQHCYSTILQAPEMLMCGVKAGFWLFHSSGCRCQSLFLLVHFGPGWNISKTRWILKNHLCPIDDKSCWHLLHPQVKSSICLLWFTPLSPSVTWSWPPPLSDKQVSGLTSSMWHTHFNMSFSCSQKTMIRYLHQHHVVVPQRGEQRRRAWCFYPSGNLKIALLHPGEIQVRSTALGCTSPRRKCHMTSCHHFIL